MRRKPSKYRYMDGEVDGVEGVDGDGEARATVAAAVFTAEHEVGERARGAVEGAGGAVDHGHEVGGRDREAGGGHVQVVEVVNMMWVAASVRQPRNVTTVCTARGSS